MNLGGARVLLTGGHGFLGSWVLRSLEARGAVVSSPRRSEYDLTKPQVPERLIAAERPQVVIHLAAVVGGIEANRREPGRFFYENIVMGVQLMDAARLARVEKFVQLGTVCAYPKHTPAPFKEADLWNGYPEETNAPYGIAKKALLVMAQSYRAQYGFNAIYLLPVNLYGPEDHDELVTSHVIPALIRKCLEARERGDAEVEVWGTGRATREFLYVEDAAEGIVAATEQYNGSEPVNLGSGEELSIRDLAELIAKEAGFQGKLRFDPAKPDGQPRRRLDTSKALEHFGWKAKVPLAEGIRRTVAAMRAAK
jgi:GDP-L-fucose synthase